MYAVRLPAFLSYGLRVWTLAVVSLLLATILALTATLAHCAAPWILRGQFQPVQLSGGAKLDKIAEQKVGV